MTGQVHEGDNWKHAAPDPKNPAPTRPELQHDANMRFAFGRITRAEWSRETDRLSEPTTEVCKQ